jgi:hypothetical protein
MAERIVTYLTPASQKQLIDDIDARAMPADVHGCKRLLNVTGAYSFNQKGYVQVTGNSGNRGLATKDQTPGTTNNTKYLVHQIIARDIANNPNTSGVSQALSDQFTAYLQTPGKNEVSHLCPNKDCTTRIHFCIEHNWVNKSRWFCPVVIIVNGTILPACKHDPQCIPNRDTIEDATSYWI